MSTSSSVKTHVTVLGAGVIGLTVAYVLTYGPDAHRFKVTGANWSPMQYDERLHQWEKRTKLPAKVYFEDDDFVDSIWWKDIVREFRVTPSVSDLPPNAKGSVEFHTVSVNPGLYLAWLKSELQSKGVEFIKHKAVSIDEVCAMAGEGGVVVNATALGAKSLIGVEDTKMYPIRGQTIVAHVPKATEFVTLVPKTPRPDGAMYLIPRPAPPGMVLVGGTFQPNNWDTSVDYPTADSIWERAKKYVPALLDPDVRILSHNVGLRPAREGGPRVETEYITTPRKGGIIPRLEEGTVESKRTLVIHAYGFGPAGYQQSWGAAEAAVELLKSQL
ncbi:FAD dependent oxidoreductase-domain-containing protein [Amylostereum chailletii]|nr:FAD dependent oxidoreductase-domain-containing protein [Amylostereum chailletii]